MFILLGIHVITSRRVQGRRRGWGYGSKHVNSKINYQLQKFTPPVLISLSNRTVFCTARGGGKTAGSNAPGAFLVFFGGHLLQTSARSKQYLPVILVRLAFFRQNCHQSWYRKLLTI